MKYYLLIIGFALVHLLTGCGAGDSSNSNINQEKSEFELKQDLETIERNNPSKYLEASYKLRVNLLGEDVIEGKVRSSATIAKFKDVVLKIRFSTKTDTHLGSKKYVIYEYVNPGKAATFKIKTYSPNGTKRIGVEVIDATPVY